MAQTKDKVLAGASVPRILVDPRVSIYKADGAAARGPNEWHLHVQLQDEAGRVAPAIKHDSKGKEMSCADRVPKEDLSETDYAHLMRILGILTDAAEAAATEDA